MTESRRQSEIFQVSDRDMMEFYNSRYFVINVKMLRSMGLWPYQNKLEKDVIRIIISTLMIISAIPQAISAMVWKENVPRLIQAIGTAIYMLGIGVKYLGMILTEKKLKNLYENMVRNWMMLENEKEKHVLKHSSEIGRLLTIGYVGYMIQAGILVITMPAVHNTLDAIWPLANGTRSQLFILDGEYFLDKEQHYYYIYLYETLTALATVPLFSSIDATYAVCIQQCVGLLNVIKMRLEHSTKQKRKVTSTGFPVNDATHCAIAKSAELHEKVLNFGRVLESSYSTSMLFVMLCNCCVLATTSTCILFNVNNRLLLIRYIFLNVGFIIHMFYLSWPGQRMIDASNAIFYAAYNNEWYDCSTESQKLLKFIMQRTVEPFYLTAGGFYIMNFENFLTLFRTSMSYIAVLTSFNT